MRQILLYTLFPLAAWTQNPIVPIPEVFLQEDRLSLQEVGRKHLLLDTNLLASYSTLADLLRQQGVLYVKEQGALSSPSFRGTTASHTQLLWNGVSLNGLSHGQVDLALFPNKLFSDVSLTFGGHSSWTGSGAIGGSIHLKSDALFAAHNKIQLLAAKGSFGKEEYAVQRIQSDEKRYVKVGFLSMRSDNDFEYVNTGTFDSPIEKQENAELATKDFVGDYALKLGKGNQINFYSWLQEAEREVPVGMLSSPSEAIQTDAAQRFLAQWKRQLKQGVFRFSQAYLAENFTYKDPPKWIDSQYEAKSSITKLHYRHFAGDFIWDIGWQQSSNQLENNYYAELPKENLLAFYSAFQLQSDSWNGVLSLRKETHPLYAVPLIPSLGLDIELFSGFKAKLSASKNFKAPAFNDLYWMGGFSRGNPDLLPEMAQSLECTLEWQQRKNNLSLTFYSTQLDDMIKWSPLEGGVWTPQNLLEVWARGLEFQSLVAADWGLFASQLSATYSFTQSTLERSALLNDAAIGQQLMYVPKHKGAAVLGLGFRQWHLQSVFVYVGDVNTTSDGLKNLDAYSLLDVQLKCQIKEAPVNLSWKVCNLLDTEYQVYEWFPTPGRNYLISINITI